MLKNRGEYLKGRCEWTGDFVWAICPAVVSRLWDGANPIEDSRQRMMINNQQFVTLDGNEDPDDDS
jgi:hypothetical protein